MPHSESVFPLGIPIAPTEPNDLNPTHIAEYGRGGLMSVATIAARDALPVSRKTVGMLVYVTAESKYYTLATAPSTWIELATGGSFVPTAVQSLYKTARNESNTTSIPKGSVVFVSGSHASTELKVDLADADLELASADTIGVAYEEIAPNASGLIQTFGYLSGITTNAVTGAEGNALYLSSTPGGFQTEVPVAPRHGVRIGFLVKKAGGGAGSIFVNIQNYQELAELSDVYIPTTPSANDTLVYDSADGRWENKKVFYSSIQPVESSSLIGRQPGGVEGTAQEIKLSTQFVWGTAGGKPQLSIATVSDATKADVSTLMSAGTGLTGGGDLSASRTFAVDFVASGTVSSTKAVRADDARLSDARTPTAHTHAIANLTDFTVTSVGDKNVFSYSAATGKWVNVPQTDLVDGGDF